MPCSDTALLQQRRPRRRWSSSPRRLLLSPGRLVVLLLWRLWFQRRHKRRRQQHPPNDNRRRHARLHHRRRRRVVAGVSGGGSPRRRAATTTARRGSFATRAASGRTPTSRSAGCAAGLRQRCARRRSPPRRRPPECGLPRELFGTRQSRRRQSLGPAGGGPSFFDAGRATRASVATGAASVARARARRAPSVARARSLTSRANGADVCTPAPPSNVTRRWPRQRRRHSQRLLPPRLRLPSMGQGCLARLVLPRRRRAHVTVQHRPAWGSSHPKVVEARCLRSTPQRRRRRQHMLLPDDHLSFVGTTAEAQCRCRSAGLAVCFLFGPR
mmetsp:Transcript_5349/g.22086  ORF Transcript_5349/g.22086 Transcript_5349/m.22086 type:complete len:328 (-) Transcript_5349:233-1216(-)